MYEVSFADMWTMIIALFGGGILIGYLLTSDVMHRTLRKADTKLADDATTIEELVASQDAAEDLIAKLQSNIRVMDRNAQVLLEQNTKLRREIQSVLEDNGTMTARVVRDHGTLAQLHQQAVLPSQG